MKTGRHLHLFVLTALLIGSPLFGIGVDDLVTIPGLVIDSNAENFSGELGLNPVDGSFHIAWVRRGDIYYRVRAFNGTWTETTVLPDAGLFVYGREEANHLKKCIAMTFDEEGVCHFIFAVDNGDLYYMKNTGDSWTTPMRIVKKNVFTIHTDIEVVGDVIHVVYENANTDLIYYVKYDGDWIVSDQFFSNGEACQLAKGSDDRLYFMNRGTKYVQRNVKFAYLLPGASDWVFVRGATNAEIYLGHDPHMVAGGGKIYLAWPSETGLGTGPKKGGMHVAFAEEPGTDWTPRLMTGYPIMYDNYIDMYPRSGIYSDGIYIVMNGVRLRERYMIWDGTYWSQERTAPWDDGDDRGGILPEAISDGRTTWVISAMNDIVLYGIQNPEGQLYYAPEPEILVDAYSGQSPLSVQFTGTYPVDVDGWSWDFGDGQTSSLQNPNHTYASSGYYTVTLTVNADWGTATKTETDYIVVQGPPPVAEFSSDSVADVVPLTVQFTDLSTNEIDTWFWTFGDGGVSDLQNPTHTYVNPGDYTVVLTVTGPWGEDSETKTEYISVQGLPPVAAFSANQTGGIAPLAVQFTDLSTNEINTWSWIFGDGGASDLQNPTHTYVNPGDYPVVLTVTGPWGEDSETKTDYIAVQGTAPLVNFSAEPTVGAAPLAVQFTDTSTGEVDTWSWTFGDGGASDLQNPLHTYNDAGEYDVALTVTGPWGQSETTKTDYIRVGNPPAADFSADPIQGDEPLTVQFTDLSTGEIDTWLWTFGDGVSSGDAEPMHIYATTGDYPVSLTVTNPFGSNTKSVDAYIHVAEVTGIPDSGIAPDSYMFHQNFPNPFNPSTTVRFDLPMTSDVHLCVYDLKGKRIRTLMEGEQPAGRFTLAWDGSDDAGQSMPSGMYVIVLRAGSYSAQRKALYLK